MRSGGGGRNLLNLLVLGEGLPDEEEVHGRENVLLAALDEVVGGLAEHLRHPRGALGGDLEVLERRHGRVGDRTTNPSVLETCVRFRI